jgi:hypothetical protein
VAGATVLTGGVVEATNATNDFVGSLQLNGTGAGSVFDANTLTFAASNFAFTTPNQTVSITAGSDITQTGALTSSGTGTLALTSLGGLINLPNAANQLTNTTALAFTVTGASPVTFVNNAGLQLGDTLLGSGTLSLSANGSMSQKTGTTIKTGGPMTLTVTSNNRDILFANAGNHIEGTVTAVESGANFLRDFNLRNASDIASLPAGTPFTTAGDVRNLTLFFDNNAIALPAYSITNNLNITAGGDISQTAALTVGGTTTATVLGDFALNLNNPANALTGNVALNASRSTQPVRIVNNIALTLGATTLGRGLFAATANTGDLTSTSAITQEKGAPSATFSAPAGDILLSGANRFPSSVVFVGTDTVRIRNTDPTASFADLSIPPGTVTDLTVEFDNAAIALPSLNLTDLDVTAQGIVQQSGATLNISNAAFFTAGNFVLNLSNAGNDFNALTFSSGGRNDVSITDVDDLTFTNASDMGTGRLTVIAGGNIAETGSIEQLVETAVGDVSFASTGGGITLGGANTFAGPLSIAVGGVNNATVNQAVSVLTLGKITTGVGSLTITGNTNGIFQDPNSSLTLGGASTFTATGGTIDLTNFTNSFAGAVSLNAATASLKATGAVALGASAVTSNLNIKTGGKATDSITQTGAITGNSNATFDSGAGNITLATATNNFTSVALFSTGTSVSITDTSALAIRSSQLGGGTLTITAGGNITSNGTLVQTTGTGAITIDTPGANNVTLNNSGNVLRGAVNILHATNVSLRSQTDVIFAPGSLVSGNLTATAGGIITLPNDLTQLDALTLSANSTTISSDVTASAGGFAIDITGVLNLVGDRVLNVTAGTVTLRNGVNVGGALTINLAANQSIQVVSGDWNQGTNPLNINGTGADLIIGGGGVASFNVTSGTVSMPGGGDVTVFANATFHVGATSAAETVTVANGAGLLDIQGNASLAVGFGPTNDRLIKTGAGNINLGAGVRLVGSGLAGATASPVLVSQTALLVGRFANSTDANGAPHDFFAGSDIVASAYDFTQVTVKAGGVTAPSGSISAFLADGDKYTVTSSLGANAGLAIVEEVNGTLSVVVRNDTAAGASTLSITTAGGGNGRLPIGGVMIHTPGSVSISAPAGDFTGTLTTIGTLTSLIARDLGVSANFTLSGGGPATGKTSITAHEVQLTTILLPGVLDKFKAVSVTNNSKFTADKFGTLTITGDVNGSNPNVAGLPNLGNFDATLTSTTAANGVVLAGATIAGKISGTWDLRGSITKVTAASSLNWTLGTVPSSVTQNGGLLTDIKNLSIVQIASTTINSTGQLTSLTTSDIGGSGNTFTAGSFGTIAVKPNPALGLAGSVAQLTLRANGNTTGVALKSLNIAGDLTGSTFTFRDGDVNSITVARTVSSTSITATDINNHGNLKALSAGEWNGVSITSRTVGTLKSAGNLKAGIFGDFTSSGVTLSGNTAGVALKTFEAKGSVNNSDFDIQNGNVTSFKVARELNGTEIDLTDPAFGNLGLIQAGQWTNGTIVMAKTIGTLASVGASAVAPASPLLLGDIDEVTIVAYQNSGTAAAIGKFSTKGSLSSSTVNAEHGIGSMTVGRAIEGDLINADDTMTGAASVGHIATLTAGTIFNSILSANTLGKVKVAGYAMPEAGNMSFVFGDLTSTNILAHGASPTKPVGIDSLTVARHATSINIVSPSGIRTLTVGGTVNGFVLTDNAATPANGFVDNFTAGEVSNSTLHFGRVLNLKTAGNIPAGLLGNISGSTIAITSGATVGGTLQALGTLTVAGDFAFSILDAPASVGKIDVRGKISGEGSPMRLQAGYDAGSKIGSITAGALGSTTANSVNEIISQSIGSITLKGNASRGFVGTTDNVLIDILGASNGVGLGTFSATGTATNSLFRVFDGDITSFTAQRLVSTDVLVGFHFVKGSDITAAPVAANWAAANHKIGSFTTTAPFDATEASDSASFVDSNVIAGILGSINISGVNPATIKSTTFGVAFRTAAGASASGTVKVAGTALTAPTTNGQFDYLGLAG